MTEQVSRRRVLSYAATAAAGVAAGTGAYSLLDAPDDTSERDQGDNIQDTSAPALNEPYGAHQVAIELAPAEVQEFLAFDVRPDLDKDGLARLLRAWTGSIESLTAGRGALGDPAPWLADAAAGLTVTVGLGPGLAAPGGMLEGPEGFSRIPPMDHDKLQPAWSGGDLLLIIGAREGTTAAHTARRLTRDAAPFARPRWRQSGTWNSIDAQGAPITGRNLFGQVDGSGNPQVGTDLFGDTVWISDGRWAGGTTVALRRIRMNMATWEDLTRDEQEQSVGRDLDTGAPLTGGEELDDLDLDAKQEDRLVIAADAHARRSHPTMNGDRRIFRRGANYVEIRGRRAESGLIFQSFQANLADQFVPIQRMLDIEDALNEWTTAVGSAEFALLPGFSKGGWLGETVVS